MAITLAKKTAATPAALMAASMAAVVSRVSLRAAAGTALGVCFLASICIAETDFYQELAATAPVAAAVAVASEGSALAAVEHALEGVPITLGNQAQRDRLTDLVQRQVQLGLKERLRAQLAAAMDEERAAALLDFAATPEGADLIEAAMLAALALRQEAGALADDELSRARPLLQSIRATP